MSFNQELDFRLESDGTIRLDPEPRHEVAPGIVHFAVLATLGEVAAARAAAASVVPTHLSVQLMRAARSDSALEARGRLLKEGRRLIFAEGEVAQDGRLVALVAVTFARVD